MVRSEVDMALHRLANFVERQLNEVFQRLLAESRARDAQSISYSGLGFVTDLRDALSEGDDE